MKEDLKRLGLIVSAFLFAAALCACSTGIFAKPSGSDNETSGESETTTTLFMATEALLTPTPDPSKDTEPLTDELALTGFTNYLYHKVKNLQDILDERKYPCTWGISSSNERQILIMYKSHTGALYRYHIDRKTGKTYATRYYVETNSYRKIKESFNVRDYVDMKPATPTPKAKVSGKPTAKPTSKPKVNVSDAVSTISVVGNSKRSYKIPRITITGKNTDAANKKIKSDLSKWPTKGANARGIIYSCHAHGKVASILVRISDANPDTSDTFKVYNVSIKTGKLVSDSSMVRLYGSSGRKYLAKVKAAYKRFGGGSAATASEAKKMTKINLKRATYKYTTPYIGNNGHLCFVGYVHYHGGTGSGYRLFDTTNKRCIG